jgi:E3 ubiquitin-protein ligase MARCH6
MISIRHRLNLRRGDWSINIYPNTETLIESSSASSSTIINSQSITTKSSKFIDEEQPNGDVLSQTSSITTKLIEETEQPRTFEEELDELSKQPKGSSNDQSQNNVNINEFISHQQVDITTTTTTSNNTAFDATEQIVPDIFEEPRTNNDTDNNQVNAPIMENEPLANEQQEPAVEIIENVAAPMEQAAPRADGLNEAEVQAEEHVNNILPRFFRQVQAWVAEQLEDEDDDDDDDDDDDNNDEVEEDNGGAGVAEEGQNDHNNHNNPADQLGANQPAPLHNNNNNDDNNAIINQIGAEFDPQFNEMAGEEFDGVLEAMGIRGPIGLLFQNAALMTILVMLALACAAWMPYIVGKTFVLVSRFIVN